jgi:hypothetical protein
MGVTDAIKKINASDRTAEEKRHLRILVGNKNGIQPELFDGIPNYDKILSDYPMITGSFLFPFH